MLVNAAKTSNGCQNSQASSVSFGQLNGDTKINLVLASKTTHCGPNVPPNVKFVIDTGLKREVKCINSYVVLQSHSTLIHSTKEL